MTSLLDRLNMASILRHDPRPDIAITDESNGLCRCDRCGSMTIGVVTIPCWPVRDDGYEASMALCEPCIIDIATRLRLAREQRAS